MTPIIMEFLEDHGILSESEIPFTEIERDHYREGSGPLPCRVRIREENR